MKEKKGEKYIWNIGMFLKPPSFPHFFSQNVSPNLIQIHESVWYIQNAIFFVEFLLYQKFFFRVALLEPSLPH